MTTAKEAERIIREELDADSEEYRDADPSAATVTKPNRDASVMYSLRLPSAVIAELNALASALDIPASVLARGFVLDGLASRGADDLRGALERLGRDVEAVKRLAAG